MRHSMRLRFLQQGKDLLPLHTGKTFEKVRNGVTGLKMVKQTLNRYPGPGKDRLASENFRVPRNDFPHGNIIACTLTLRLSPSDSLPTLRVDLPTREVQTVTADTCSTCFNIVSRLAFNGVEWR